ncbi:MAG: glycosyltransferase [Acidimicrobiales bacterium]
MPGPTPVPVGFGIRLHPETRWLTPTVLHGGSPPLVVTLSAQAADAVRRLSHDEPVDAETAEVARRLLDADMAVPIPSCGSVALGDIAVVIPARNAAASLTRLFDSLPTGVGEVVVADDGSVDETANVARARGARVVPVGGRGPSAARNCGLRAVRAPMVLLVDADTVVEQSAVALLGAHLADPAVAVVAPRIAGLAGRGGGRGLVARYEAARSPLDVGALAGRARRGSRLTFVPSAALLVRREAVLEVGGFDEELQTGEDTDLCWRLDREGWVVRYEPAGLVYHEHRERLASMLRRRVEYGRPYAALGRRHPGGFVAVTRPAQPVMPSRLTRAGVLRVDVDRIVARERIVAARSVLFAATQPWLPALTALAVMSGRVRRLLVATLLARHLGDWQRSGRPTGPLAWVALRTADDMAFAVGVWLSAIEARSPAPLSIRRDRGSPQATDDWTVVAQLR